MCAVNSSVETALVLNVGKFVTLTMIVLMALMKWHVVSLGNSNSHSCASMLCLAPRPFGRCFSKEFSCGADAQCIDFTRVCDGTVDCQDQSDEASVLCGPSGRHPFVCI